MMPPPAGALQQSQSIASSFGSLFSAEGFMPHGHCYRWEPDVLWLHVISDSVITLAYYSIPVALFMLVRRRRDLAFNWMFLMFGAFIFACGTTHAMNILTVWNPVYRADGVVKLMTAAVSAVTAVALWPLIPKAVLLPSPKQLRESNARLEEEIGERIRAENALRLAHAELEARVQERTAELAAANVALQDEISERKRADATLAESDERFRAMFNNAPVGIARVGLDGRFLEANPALCAMLGYDCGELTSMPPEVATPPEDAAAVAARRRGLIEGDADVVSAERRFVRQDGSVIWCSATTSLVRGPDGAPSHLVAVIHDITLRKRAQDEVDRLNHTLHERVGELETLLDVIPLGIAVALDPACETIRMNAACASILGLRPEDNASKSGPDAERLPFKVLRNGRELAPEELPMQRAASAGIDIRDYEIELVRDDGVALSLLEYASPVFDERGRVRGCLGVFVDVTQLKRAEQAVQASTERLRLVARATNDTVWDWDLTTRELSWNDALRQFFGYDPDSFTIERWTEALHPDDREKTIHDLEAAIAQSENWTCEYRFRRAGGEYATVLDRGYVSRDERGRPVRMIGSMLDLTERMKAEQALRASEERFRFLAEAIPQIVWTARPDGLADYFNQRWIDYTGLPLEQSLGAGWRDVIHPDDQARSTERWSYAVATGLNFEMESRLRRADGAHRWHLHRAFPMRDAEGRVVKWFGTSTDIDDKKRAEEALRAQAVELAEANVQLDRSNQELEDFAYIASHDLKEPLRGIHNYSTFLLEDYAEKLDDEGRSKLEALTRLSRRMEALIDTLLYYSRVGRTELAIAETDLGKVVGEVLESLDPMIKERAVDVRIPMPLPTVRCDRVRVAEVFRNLIVNAIKYNDSAEPWVEISWRNDDQAPAQKGGVRPVLFVRDNGIGIPERHLESVFRIFRRLHPRDKYGGGTGSGLTIVKKIIERHGGRIWIESIHGEGSSILFTLSGDSDAHG